MRVADAWRAGAQEELEVILHVSADKGKTFQRAQFPYQLSERSYRVIDAKEESVFVQVAHGSRDSSFANVYMSGPSGREYSLSLRGVVKVLARTAAWPEGDSRIAQHTRPIHTHLTCPEPQTLIAWGLAAQDYRGLTDFERINGVDGVYVANVADQEAEPELSLLGGLQAVIFNNHLVRSAMPGARLCPRGRWAYFAPASRHGFGI